MAKFKVKRREIWETEVFIEGDKITSLRKARLAVAKGDGTIESDSVFVEYDKHALQWEGERLEVVEEE